MILQFSSDSIDKTGFQIGNICVRYVHVRRMENHLITLLVLQFRASYNRHRTKILIFNKPEIQDIHVLLFDPGKHFHHKCSAVIQPAIFQRFNYAFSEGKLLKLT